MPTTCHEEYGSACSDYVFINIWAEPKGHAWSYQAVLYDLVLRLRARTGITFDPHWYRHGTATRWLRDGVPIEVVSTLLGHSSVSVTSSVYGHLTVEDARAALEKGGWRAGREVRGDRRLDHAGRPVPLAAAGRRRTGRHPGREPERPRDRVDRDRVPAAPCPARFLPPPRAGAHCSPNGGRSWDWTRSPRPVRGRDAGLPARPRCPRRRHGQRHRDRLRRRGGQPVSGPDAADAGHCRVPAGLLEKLMAAVRPEFRADDLVFDPRDPLLRRAALRSERLRPPAPQPGTVHLALAPVAGSGRPGPGRVRRDGRPGGTGHLPLAPCTVTGCNYGAAARGAVQPARQAVAPRGPPGPG